MRKKIKIIAVLLTFVMLLSTNVSAATIIMNGKTDAYSAGVTVLVTTKGADLTNITSENIIWVNQGQVKSDGSFSIRIPLLEDVEYDFYTNANSHSFSDTKNRIMYVSQSGSDANGGMDEDSAVKTLAPAYSLFEYVSETVIVDKAAYTDAPSAYEGDFIIKGKTASSVLTLPGTINLKGNLKIDNITLSGASTIYANGYTLEIGENVTSDSRITVFGGSYGKDVENTNVVLLGGQYANVYGGGNNGKVTGKTNVVLGGNANPNDSIDDSASNKSQCYVYGGGNNGLVSKSTNITLKDNAVALYLVGAGTGDTGTATNTNINISGGQVMNVYAASRAVPLTGCDTHITMTGGIAEALYGGTENAAFSGNTYITLKGGLIIRRVYTGCYNNVDIGASDVLLGGSGTWSADNYVKGTTTLAIYPEMEIDFNSSLLADDNKVNLGLFSGSRTQSSHSDEINTIIYLNGSQSSHNTYMGEHSSKYSVSLSKWMKTYQNYTVAASTGGTVYGTNTGGVVGVIPDKGRSAVVNGTRYFKEGNVILTNASTTINFDGITSATLEETNTGIAANVGVTSSQTGKLIFAVYDEETNSLKGSSMAEFNAATGEYTLNVDCTLKENGKYVVKLFLWDSLENMKPLATVYKIQL